MSRGKAQLTRKGFYLRCLYRPFFNLRETDCYSWHEQGSSHSGVCGPLGLPSALGSLSPETKLQQITAARSARCRVVPGGRRSPLRSKELWNCLRESQRGVVLSRRHTCASSAYELRPQ